MRGYHRLAAVVFALALALAPSLGFARAGSGASMGSRGGFTYSAPPSTRTAPGTAAPFERSLTPQTPPSYANQGLGAPQPGYAASRSSPFVSGLMGGLIGAGIGGMLFGHGLFGGISGIGGFFGLLLQIFLIVWLGRMALRLFFGRATAPARAQMGPNIFAPPGAGAASGSRPMPSWGGGGGGRPAVQPVTVTAQDFQAFEQLLRDVQAAWTAHDVVALQRIATPEMVSFFADQLSGQASRGVRNAVTDVRLEQGDLAQAWAEGDREYATVAMRFSMVDVTRDGLGRVVEGDPELRTMATEIWTFVRARGGRWLLSAIQQTR